MQSPQHQLEGIEWGTTIIVLGLAILSVALLISMLWDQVRTASRRIWDFVHTTARRIWDHVRPIVQWSVFVGGGAATLLLFSHGGGLIRNLNESVLYGIGLVVVLLVFSLLRFRPYKAKRILGTVRQTAPAKFIIRLIGQRTDADKRILSSAP